MTFRALLYVSLKNDISCWLSPTFSEEYYFVLHLWKEHTNVTANHSLIVLKILDLFIPISTKFLWDQSKRKVV